MAGAGTGSSGGALCYSRRASGRRDAREAIAPGAIVRFGALGAPEASREARRCGRNAQRRDAREAIAPGAIVRFGALGAPEASREARRCERSEPRRDAREAEGGALLRRYTGSNPYRGFESLSLRQKPRTRAGSARPRCGRREASKLLCSREGCEGFGAALAPPNRGRRHVGESLSLRQKPRTRAGSARPRCGRREASKLLCSREGCEGFGAALAPPNRGRRHVGESLSLRPFPLRRARPRAAC